MESTTEEDLEDFWDNLRLENLTEVDYLNRVLGPKNLPLNIAVPLTVAYLIIFITGIFGNITTCMVIIKNSSMQNATNYYLFSLAISDLILLVLGLPNEISVFWQQYPWVFGLTVCKIRAYVSEMSSYVSVLTIVAFSMERYLAICHPFRVNAMSGLKRPISFILGSWSIAMISAIPFIIYSKLNYVEYPPKSGNESKDSAICAMLLPDMPHYPLYEMSCLIFFLIPMIIIFILYVRMGLKIHKSARNSLGPIFNQNSVHTESKQFQSRKSIIRMLSAVVVLFFICWAPFHTQRLFYIYGANADYYPDLNEFLYIFSGFLYYFSTTINPILYNLMSSRYRKAFKETLCCKGDKKQGLSNFSKINTSRLNSDQTKRTSNIQSSFRHSINQAKEMFLSNLDQESDNKNNAFDTKGNSRKSNLLYSDNHSTRALLDKTRHSSVKMQTSNECSESKDQVTENVTNSFL
ncbi:neuropeptides capa receptor-like [Leptopilina heterotoma]|uniref:neuropeptides capa receptor-like n=1 Tax=Leptopilina heterotoma TaxID=63436 RepID=UPI001CA99D34|nr:neuropeptides capa receptor-like [Leptopilina heterotoma]XP_043466381.1 neuropeptides capa receptor-like [Leptopilina heterotoma]